MLGILTIVWAVLSTVWCVNAAPSNHTHYRSRYYAIKGVHTSIGRRQTGATAYPRPARRNILDLQQDMPSWSLYIQALTQMQDDPEGYFLSFYQLAGIHGRPYVAWNDAEQAPNAPLTGYCTHSSVLFLSWHRPYLALFEQVLASIAQDLVNTYPAASRQVYQNAANRLRIPYWDWAAINSMPDVLKQPTITITTGASMQSVRNPLYRYKFQNFPMDPNLFPSFEGISKCPQTTRAPAKLCDSDQPDLVNYYLSVMQITRDTWYSLVKPQTYNIFGTTATAGSSIEGVHNNVHGACGGGNGHMTFLGYSAFDPIFWLHHTNVDRLAAIWQAINPDSYITPALDASGTFAIPPNTLEDMNTPLRPFAVTGNGAWYTSASSRSTSTFGYTYPEIQDWNQTPQQLKANVTAAIYKLYNPAGQFTKRRTLIPGQTTREWFVGLKVSKGDLHGERFIIRIFLGHVPKDPHDWQTNAIGSFAVFPPQASSAGQTSDIIANYEVSLVEALSEKGHNLEDVNSVSTVLKKDLRWRVQMFDGTIVSIKQIPSLVVSVQDEIVTIANDDTQLPTYGEKTLHPNITRTKAGGYDGKASV